ncbi:unnamed protein product [Allacma fusca]|uniref:Uncharacterized protein n=1 Tax=Allacma fusca TaxID=39272 RepID=A0A8J2K121_9HEXA|nr:unnamed protein product [Allacma fusca]
MYGDMSGSLGWIGGLRGVGHLLRMTMESGKRVYNAFSIGRDSILLDQIPGIITAPRRLICWVQIFPSTSKVIRNIGRDFGI